MPVSDPVFLNYLHHHHHHHHRSPVISSTTPMGEAATISPNKQQLAPSSYEDVAGDDETSTVMSTEDQNRKALEFIDHVTSNADEIQGRVLAEILSRSAHVEYLQKHGLQGRTDRETFKKVMPVVTYEDLSPYIQRIADGDTSPILCSQPISEFLTSSGTSGGERKVIPTIEEESGRRSLLYSLIMPVLSQFLEGLEKGKGMYFLFIKSEAKTPGGLLARPVLTSYYKSPHFKIRPTDPYTNYTSPIETVLCPDSFQSLYSQALCGLTHRTEVLRVGAVFASAFIRAVKFLENHWSSLSHDIRVGKPDPRVVTDPAVREAVMRVMQRPNSDLADLVEKECGKKEEPWKGIIKRLWPNTKYIEVVVTGTMAQYIPTLEYYGDGLPLVSPMYASSECYFGINLNPMCSPSEVAYTLLPNMAYFEFLPLENPHHINIAADHHRLHSHHLVDLVDVQLGKEYELVLTTYAGLYRYCVGDILRVAGFKNKAPQFNFIRRKNVALSIDSDKTDEVELHNAVTKATDHLLRCEYSIVEYTSYVDTSTIPGHYVLFWEISHDKTTGGGGGEGGSGDGDHHHHDLQLLPSSSVMEDCCLTIEESLNSVYRQCRASDKSIGPLEIRVVETGTFDMLMDHAVTTTGASINQYKTPRCVKYPPIIDLLNSRVLSKYFSPKCPKWLPGHKQWRST